MNWVVLPTWSLLLPLLPLGGILVMVGFMALRRWWRGRMFARRDALRRRWLERLPVLLSGVEISRAELDTRDRRETLETLVIDRLDVATGQEAERLKNLLERAGFLDRHVDWLRRVNRWQKLQSAALLGRAGARVAIPALLVLLRNPSSELRQAAARALTAIGDPRAASALLECTAQPSLPLHPKIWLHAAVACRVPTTALISLLHDRPGEIRALAARAVSELPEPATFDQVQEFAFDPDEEVRAQMARILGRTADPRAAPLLVSLAQDPVWFVRLRALAGIGELNRPECLDAVLHGTRDSHFQVRQRAASTLARLAAKPLPVLRYLANAGDRYALEAYLSQLGRSGLLWRTIALLRSAQAEERQDAASVLGAALRAGATQEFLYALETHPDFRVRLKVARLLVQQGTPELLPAIEQIQARLTAGREQRLLRWIGKNLPEAPAAPGPREGSCALAGRV